ncbi:NAD-dependent epimerase/dehydratase family protein [Streptomyces sp. NPDC091272]|uniref:NAD-dependent epimerase/dehydratase family protein n=1 Tax=Streptomyces sp. NPDC091272 TaxID=3365981 RepID=UPI00380FC43B
MSKRVVITGATGNVGTSVLRALAADPEIGSVHGIARRIPDGTPAGTTWTELDLGAAGDPDKHPASVDALAKVFDGADAVIHLAWLFQPTHKPEVTWRTNVLGSLRVFEAAARARVPALIHASSVGAYSPGPKDRPVPESWPTHGWPDAAYCREKAYLERILDLHELRCPEQRVVRMRPAFLFKRESAAEQRRLFAGPLLPNRLVRPHALPVVPDVPGLRVQALHTDDAAQAYRLAVLREVRGAFNLAADPPVDAKVLAEMFGARAVRTPRALARGALAAGWGARLLPASPHLFDAVLRMPLMDCTRAREELDWRPRHSSVKVLEEFLSGLRDGSGGPTPPLAPRVPGGRAGEATTGMGTTP